MPTMPRSFGLTAPIKQQLEAILRDYPGGQLLSEALQNAEDSGASTFVLTLDLRAHDAVKERSLDQRLSRPAFVLADDGRGFGDREWSSLQKLHASEKSDSPREIGRFGMGSRSYFHYADTILVVSNGEYCGLDPLHTVTSVSDSLCSSILLDSPFLCCFSFPAVPQWVYCVLRTAYTY